MSKNGDSAFQKKFFRRSVEIARQFMTTAGKAPEGKADEYYYVFLTGGMLMLIQEWLKNDMDTPIPELAEMLAKLAREVLR